MVLNKKLHTRLSENNSRNTDIKLRKQIHNYNNSLSSVFVNRLSVYAKMLLHITCSSIKEDQCGG